MKYIIPLYFLLASLNSFAQKNTFTSSCQIIDISQMEIRIVNEYKYEDSSVRSRFFSDTLFQPYKNVWTSYVGRQQDLIGWLNNLFLPNLTDFKKKSQQINGKVLATQFEEIKTNMEKLTGHSPKSTWYIVYGPAWTDLGAISEGIMLIDLGNQNNSSYDAITMMIPRELTRQIIANVNPGNDISVLGSIVNEGCAAYVNQLYWKGKYTAAQNLGYTQNELNACTTQEQDIKSFFEENKYSTDKKTVEKFKSRNFHLKDNLPGAIGCYIGYKIILKYVQKFGPNSWKDVFTKSPKEIYTLSGF